MFFKYLFNNFQGEVNASPIEMKNQMLTVEVRQPEQNKYSVFKGIHSQEAV